MLIELGATDLDDVSHADLYQPGKTEVADRRSCVPYLAQAGFAEIVDRLDHDDDGTVTEEGAGPCATYPLISSYPLH
eukprot:COSAG02_NODE_7062_length_3202_cov_25.313568_2_plen_77_part_00